MKKLIYIVLLCTATTATLFAQNGKDCVTSASICGSALVPAPTAGIGSVTDAVPNPCSGTQTETATAWNNSTWVTLVVTTAGTLQMNFNTTPNSDIDFVMWRIPSGVSLSTACGSLATYNTDANRRCDYNSDIAASGFGSTTCGTGAGCDPLGAMTVAVGDRIIAIVSDYSTFGNLAFTADIGGTSARTCNVACNLPTAASCTNSSIYSTFALANAGIDGCNADQVRTGLVAGTQVQQYCSTFTTPASLTNSSIGFAGSLSRAPAAAPINFTSETLYSSTGTVLETVAFTQSGFAYWRVQPSTTYQYCMTWTGVGTTQQQNPCARPFYAACAMTAVTIANKSACNGNATVVSTDDYYTADITVTYTGVPGSGTLGLSGAQIHTPVTPVAVASAGATTYTFVGVKIKANSTASAITAAFSADGACTVTSTSHAAVAPCSCAAGVMTLGVTTP